MGGGGGGGGGGGWWALWGLEGEVCGSHACLVAHDTAQPPLHIPSCLP